MWNYFEIELIFERVHYCGCPAVTKTGYDEGIPWISRIYSICDTITIMYRYSQISVAIVKQFEIIFLFEKGTQVW